MFAVLSIVLNTLSLTLASRMMNIALGIIPAILVAAFCHGMGAVLDGLDKPLYIVGIIIGLLIYFAGLKRFTGENTWTLVKLTVVWIILGVVIAQAFFKVFELSFAFYLRS
ncbi:hypothetical protein [Pseudomonas cichorii]|uniref:hypothetical protein n=1 Tax=Pseudomonas cichorii TaxID=36746 RepID=UPI001C8AB163|nr:hypothetical protein [Pseudomonas cichorii]MBX8496795.1 hypothetical protein [Pseudomonas cichorii]